jgi:hypothetical protein
MRIILCSFVSICFLVCIGVTRADDQKDARAIIDKAIKVSGGEKRLSQVKAETWEEKGTYYGMGDGLPYIGKYAAQWPDKFRMEIKDVFTIVLNGDKGWVSSFGNVEQMSKEQLAEQMATQYVGNVSRLITLGDKKFTLATLKDTKVGDAVAVGVKVSSKDHPDVKLFFDKESGLLIKSENMGKSEEFGDKEILQETSFANYKDFNGMKVATKLVMHYDGKKYIEAEVTKHKELDKLEASLFEAPK